MSVKMQDVPELQRAAQDMHPASYERRMFQRCSTYLAMIAFILQGSPNHMLTFSELMHKLEALVTRDRRGLAGNIRVCLSTNKCFVKIASNPENPNGKKNYWKLDHSRISLKMARRHFKEILERFPELAFKVRKEAATPLEPCTALQSPGAGKDVHLKGEKKFTGPFSIDSLLRKDDASLPATKPCRLSHIPYVPIRVRQQPWSTEISIETKRKFSWDSLPVDEHFLQPSNGNYNFYPAEGSTDRRLSGAGLKPTSQMHMSSIPFPSSFVVSAASRVGPYFTGLPRTKYPKYIL